MLRLGRFAGQKAGIALIVLGLTLGLGIFAALPASGGIAVAGPSHAGLSPALATPQVSASPAHGASTPAASTTPTQVTMHLTDSFGVYTVLPTPLVLNLTVNNSILYNWYNASGVEFTNTYLWLNVSDITANAACGTNNLTAMITNATTPAALTNYTEYLSFNLDNSYFVNDTVACPNLAADVAYIEITAVVNGGANGVATGTAYSFGVYSLLAPPGWGVNPTSSFIFSTPTSVLQVSPVAGSTQTFNLQAKYTAQYVGSVEVYVYNPTGTGVVFSANLRWNGTTPTTASWTETTPGLYPYTLTVFTAFGQFNSTGSISVVAPTPVYYNTSHYSNSTLISGLSSGAAGAILLVVGLVIGMIVAMALGRAVWGGKRAAPAQPWSGEKAATTNSCSVCGQSFATPEELAAHGKSEHGMQ